jgi:hypothetical protein
LRQQVRHGAAAQRHSSRHNDIVEAEGIKLPSQRRAYRCDASGRLLPDELMVSIDVSDINLI